MPLNGSPPPAARHSRARAFGCYLLVHKEPRENPLTDPVLWHLDRDRSARPHFVASEGGAKIPPLPAVPMYDRSSRSFEKRPGWTMKFLVEEGYAMRCQSAFKTALLAAFGVLTFATAVNAQ